MAGRDHRPGSSRRDDISQQISQGYPYKTLAWLKENSPSRKHGVTEEQEARWKHTAINLIITAALKLQMDHVGAVTALEFLHRFYAQFSMVTNDRFLMSAACLYLAGKVADSPKGCTAVLGACLEAVTGDSEDAKRKVRDQEWLSAAREAVFRAERALLYQLGYRFSHASAPEAVIRLLLGKPDHDPLDPKQQPPEPPLPRFLDATYGPDKEARAVFSRLAYHFANQSAKTLLCMQYEAVAVAAACIWLAMKMLRVDSGPLKNVHRGQPWYREYRLNPTDLDIIAAQITESMIADVEAAKRLDSQALEVKVHFEQMAAGRRQESALSPRVVDPPAFRLKGNTAAADPPAFRLKGSSAGRGAAAEQQGSGRDRPAAATAAAALGATKPGQVEVHQGGSGAAVKRSAELGRAPGSDEAKRAKQAPGEDLESMLTELDNA